MDIGILNQKGSLFCTRPTLFHYTAAREDLLVSANDLFDVVGRGIVKIEVNQRYPLREAAQCHIDVQSRKTTGSTILIP
jgi:NADPH2:quinone reductase